MTLLAEIGEALWGPRWQSELARALDIADRTVRRWVAGEVEPPAGVYAELMALATQRRAALRALMPRLRVASRQPRPLGGPSGDGP